MVTCCRVSVNLAVVTTHVACILSCFDGCWDKWNESTQRCKITCILLTKYSNKGQLGRRRPQRYTHKKQGHEENSDWCVTVYRFRGQSKVRQKTRSTALPSSLTMSNKMLVEFYCKELKYWCNEISIALSQQICCRCLCTRNITWL